MGEYSKHYKSLALYQISNRYLQALDDFERPESEIEERTVTDTLEAITGEFEDKTLNIVKYLLNIEGAESSLKLTIRNMENRRAGYERKITWLKEYLKRNMAALNIDKIEFPEFVIKVAKNPPKIIIKDEELIPEEYKRKVLTIFINKTDIKKAINDGEDVSGAQIISGTRLIIK